MNPLKPLTPPGASVAEVIPKGNQKLVAMLFDFV